MNASDILDIQIFASVPEVAFVMGLSEKTVRRAIARGEVPATKIGQQYRVPVAWLREQAGG